MKEFKHTPGPLGWSHREVPNGNYSTQVYDASGKEIATIAWYPVRQNNITTSSREANARLIAAAPHLLAALEECIFALEPYDDVKPRDWVTDREKLRRSHQAARAAIAKALGETK